MATQPRNDSLCESSPQGRSCKQQPKPNRLKLQLGESWPNGISVNKLETGPAYPSAVKTVIIIATFGFSGALITALAIHGMVTDNQQRLDSILRNASSVFGCLILWATSGHQWYKAKSILIKTLNILKE